MNGKSSQDCCNKAGVFQGSTLGLAILLLNINVPSDDVIYNTVINTNEDTLSSTCEHIFDLLQKFWLDSELEPATPGPV